MPASAISKRAQLTALAFMACLLAVLSFASPSRAATFPIVESFENTTAPGWTLGGTAALTAPTDGAGNGWLRLTPAQGSKAGYAFYDTAFPSNEGILVDFDYATWGGSGADGLTFFLYDGSTSAAQFRIGAFGGSLGYGPCSSGGTLGLKNAYVGVGFDEFGNFSNLGSICGGGVTGNTLNPNYVSVRGSEANNYPLLVSAPVTGGVQSGDRANARHVTLSVTPAGKLTVTIKLPNGTFQTVTSNYQLPVAPATLKLGYAASTGGSTNIHEIRTSNVVKPTDIVTTTTDGQAGVARGVPITWTSTVTNNGPNVSTGETVTATTGSQSLTGVTWTCAATGGATCSAASGSGLPNRTEGSMPIDGKLTYTVTGTPAAATDFAQLTLTAVPTGDTGDLAPADNAATDTTNLTPVIDTAPTFTLTAGGLATVTPGTTRGGNITQSYQWQRCDPNGTNCVNIAGATAATYTTTAADRGKTIRVIQTATNSVSNVSSTSAVYAPLPVTTITSGPNGPSGSTSATYLFSTTTTGAIFECSLDGAAYSACTSPQAYAGLATGAHTFGVRAVYGGLSDVPVTRAFTVDTTAPDSSITASPASNTNATTASFSFSGTDVGGTGVASYQCQLDAAAYAACTSPQAYAGPLAQGNHTFNVRAIDAAGNTDASPATYTWRVDTTAPTVSITGQPAAQSGSNAATFTFTGADPGGSGVASFECKLDSGAYAPCTSPLNLTGLADGSHTESIRSIDAAGNPSAAAVVTWTVDTLPPDTSITANPAANTSATFASFSFTGTDAGSGVASYECQLDAAAYAPCTSPQAYAGPLAQGNHTFNVRAIDNATRVDPTPATYTWRVDTTAPTTTVTAAPPAQTSSTTANFTFTGADPGGSGVASFQCKVDAAAYATCTSPLALTGLSSGSHTVLIRAVDAAGNADPAPVSTTWVIDSIAPDTSITAQPAANAKLTTASFSFTGSDPGGSGVASFECKLDAGAYVACTSPQAYAGPLADGNHTFNVRSIDGAGNVDASPATYTWRVDTANPTTTITASPAAVASSASASFSFTGADPGGSGVASFECKLDAAVYAPCTSPLSLTGLSAGAHTMTIRAIDAAGNADAAPPTYTWTVDTTAPDTTISAQPAANIKVTTANFTFAGTDPGGSGVASFECKLDAAAYAPCTSPKSFTALAEGSHTVLIRAIDAGGNVDPSPASVTFRVDTGNPTTTVTSAPGAQLGSTTANFSFTGADPGGSGVASFECKLDAAAYAPCTSPASFTGLSAGSHTVLIRAIDNAGNADPAPVSTTFNVDTAAPNTAITAQPAANAKVTTASFSFTGSDPGGVVASFECKLDAAAYAPCNSPKSYTALGDGSHTFSVRAIDGAGNVDGSPATYSWVVDTANPTTTIGSTPPALSATTTANFTFSGADPGSSGVASFECKLDAGAYAPCTSPKSYTGLGNGSHTFSVRAIDTAGNTDPAPATYTWTIDLGAPDTALTSQPSANTQTNFASFSFTGSDANSGVASFECKLDGAAYAPCTSPQAYAGPLAEGTHTFSVRAINNAGTVDPSPAVSNWRIDTTSPTTTVTVFPAAQTNTTTANFTFTGSDPGGSGIASFECDFDGSSWAPCSSPLAVSGLSNGPHTMSIRSIDAAGNPDSTPQTFSWSVDTTAPQTTLTSTPSADSSSTSASFAFTGSDAGSGLAGFECAMDTGTFTSCTSPKSYTGLGDGSHTFSVRALDVAGNSDGSPASYTWNVDTSGPTTTITSKPSANSPTSSATFVFSGSDAGSGVASYECDFDGSSWAPCSSPKTVTGLAAGSHTMSIRAIDNAGNPDPTPPTITWVVDTVAPQTTLGTTPPANTGSGSATFTFSGTDVGAGVTGFQCKLDNTAWAPCSSPKTYPGLADGDHTFQVSAIDAAGNIDGSPSVFLWTIDSAAPTTTIDSGPPATTGSKTAQFTFSGSDGSGSGVASFECKLDAAAYAPCTSPKTYTGLADGAHTVLVRAIDNASNPDATPPSFTWTVNSTGPSTSIDTKLRPTPTTRTPPSPSPAPPAARTSASSTAAPGRPARRRRPSRGLTDGSHTVKIRGTDTFGNVEASPASYTWTVDTQAPVTDALGTTPAAQTSDTSGTFTFTGTDPGGSGVGSFECQLDAGIWKPCTSPKTFTGLADGDHTVMIRAVDQAGNSDPDPQEFSWTVDTAAPTTTITSNPSAIDGSDQAEFDFDGDDGSGTGVDSFECQLDGGAWTTCSSPSTFFTLSDGSHTFNVRASDAVGNTDAAPATFTWTVDTGAPTTSVSASPPSETTSTSAAFAFSGTDSGGSPVTFECKLDSGAWVPCTSVKTYTGLVDGSHTVLIRAVDGAGNADPSPVSTTWTVDTTAPTTTILTKPAAAASSATANFTFSGADGSAGSGVASFECRVDAGTWAPCTSPASFPGLTDGSHSVEIRATDDVGNVEVPPASYSWVVDTGAPSTSLGSGPAANSGSSSASFTFTGSDGSGSGIASFQCQLDGGSWTTCTSPNTYTALSDGSHTVKIRAVDNAGNPDPAPVSTTWTVDTGAPTTTVTAAPSAQTSSQTASFTFSGSDAGSGVSSFECQLDGGTWTFAPRPRASPASPTAAIR